MFQGACLVHATYYSSAGHFEVLRYMLSPTLISLAKADQSAQPPRQLQLNARARAENT